MEDNFDLLSQYASFLLKERISQLARLFLQRAATINYLLLLPQTDSSEKQQLSYLEHDFKELLSCLASGKGKEHVVKSILEWRNHTLFSVNTDMEGVAYLVTSINIRKYAFIKLLNEYTTHLETREQIIIELVEFYSYYFLKLIEAFGEIKQEQILEEKEFTQSIINTCVDGISAFDKDWRVTEWNPAMEKMNGIRKQDILGKSFYDLFPAYEHSEEALEAEKVFEGQPVYLSDRQFKDGTGWYDAHFVPLHNSKKEVIGALSITHDLSQRKKWELQLQEDQHFIQSLADTSPDVITVYDLEKSVNVYSSKEIYDILGYSTHQLEELKNKGVQGLVEVIHPEDLPLILQFLDSYKTYQGTKARDLEYRIKDYKGEYRWIMDRYNVFKRSPKGLPTHIIGVARDSTARKIAEEELKETNYKLHETNEELLRTEELLKEANNQLEERVEKRTFELLEKNKQLSRINEDLDNFIYMASHDLKSPIANIEGLITVLTKKLSHKFFLDEEQINILSLIAVSIDRLKSTIINLTEIAKAQKGDEEREVISIEKEINEVFDDLDKQRPIDTDLILQKHLEVDQLKIAQKNLRSILYNLLSNAIKYRSPERKLEIVIKTKREGNHLLIKVSDNGIGIAPHHLPKVFTMFKRFHTHVEGTGIGLYIIKRIVENAGGKIELESKVDKGTTFRVYLPQSFIPSQEL
jgi:PAS domain S-box-containing protein